METASPVPALQRHERHLQNESSTEVVGSTWEMIYVGCVLIAMFAALLSDKIGADMVMLGALTMCMVANVITVSEGVSGFSNEGVLTVVVLFVVAASLQVTGGLDWYMGKLLGKPASIPAAQIRLMLPIMFVSAFLNNTPVVVVMIPIVQVSFTTSHLDMMQFKC
jgi:di/tricarboxylate transporter